MRRFLFLFLISSCIEANGQSSSGSVIANINIVNQLTGKSIDADLAWYNQESVKRLALGKYSVVLGADKEETLTISRAGYFDTELKLDYETVKQNSIYDVQMQPGIPQLHISVVDAQNNKKVDSSIDLYSLDEATEIFSERVEVAPYTIDLEYDQVHVLQVRAPGYFSFKDTLDFKGVFEGRVRAKEIKMVPLKAGNKIALNNIYFEKNQAELTPFAKLMLAELSHVLENQKALVIEVGAFTDDAGSDQYNVELSQKRALSVKQYLVEKGAKKEQLLTKGYGESNPVAPNTSDANRALNRRVEFKIVKSSYQ